MYTTAGMKESKLIIGTVLVGVLSLIVLQYEKTQKRRFICDGSLWEKYEHDEFEGFNNETGVLTDNYIVPNYVHFLRMGSKMKKIKFIDAVVMLAAFKKQRPDKIFVHTDLETFTGDYWKYLLNDVPGFRDVIVLVKTELPKSIFNQTFSKDYHFYHSSDVLRINILLKYGGIFLDNDSFMVKSLDPFRRFEMALGWDDGEFLGTQVLVAHRRARFLRLWLDSYKDHYYPDLWYFNAGEWPTVSILWARPELVHRVRLLFGVHDLRNELFTTRWKDWRDQFSIHLLTRHLKFLMKSCDIDYKDENDLTESFVKKYHNTFRDMISEIYEFNPSINVNEVKNIVCKE
ncbi:uncharacterized protein LOC142329264 [Lycorma delicatula]|uniref:uncharacterized protein LOC142329264 n=1 Tax=Lycorma delicatula TaxID=130591 RepID=UPI003F5153DD